MSNSPDSISSGAAYYSNPYRQDPGFRQANRVLVDQKRRLDSIQSEQQRLERDLQSQFQNNLRLPPGSLVLAFEVGRYIVLAIFMPPYYIVYEGPKWLFLQIKPFILEGLEKGEEVFKLIQSFIILNLKNLFQLTIEKPLSACQKILQKLTKSKEKGLHKEKTSTHIVDLSKVIFKALSKPFQQLAKIIPYVQAKYQEFKKVFLEQAKVFYPHVKKLIQKTLQQLQNNVQERVEKVKSTLKPYVQKINATFNTVVNAISKKTQEVIQSTLIVPVKTAYQFIQKIAIQNLVVPLQTLLRKIIQEKLVDPFKQTIAAVTEPLKNIAKQVSNHIKEIKERVEVHLQTALKVVSMPIALLTNVYAKAFFALQANVKPLLVPFRHFVSTVKRIGNTLKRGVQRVTEKASDYLKEKMSEFKQWSSKGKKVIQKGAEIVVNKIKQVPINLLQRLKNLLAWIKQVISKFLNSLKIAYIWVKILVRYSFQKPSGFR